MKTIIAVIFLVFAIIIGLGTIEQNMFMPNINSSSNNIVSLTEESTKEEINEVAVTLSGEVINPGTYTLEIGLYLDAAIQLAGGVTSNADKSCFNYFYVIEDNISIYIAPLSDYDKVSINQATIDSLTDLEGIGPTLAKRIIEYRNTIGSYQYLEQIMEVDGIGKSLFEKNKDKICL